MTSHPLTSYISRIALCASLAIAVSGCEERQRVDVEFVGGIAMMVHGMQLQRDLCIALFPANTQKYVRAFEQSAIPKYTEVFDYRRTFEFDDQQSLPESHGMSEEESRLSCNEDYLEALKMFDSQYADYVDEVVAIVPKIGEAAKKAAAGRAEEWANPSGEQNELLFRAIVDSLNRSFLSGDWSILSNLYDDGTFDCWNIGGNETNFSFLARQPIPPDARHEIRALERPYLQGNMIEQPSPMPTHLMQIWFEVSYPSKCSDRQSHRWPKYHFLLTKSEQEYKLVHGCPTKRYFERLVEGPVWKSLSKDEVDEKLLNIPNEEWNLVPEEIRTTLHVSSAITRLTKQYELSYDEASLIIDEICRVSTDE